MMDKRDAKFIVCMAAVVGTAGGIILLTNAFIGRNDFVVGFLGIALGATLIIHCLEAIIKMVRES